MREVWIWVQANNSLRDIVCRGLMLVLQRLGLIELPPVRLLMIYRLVKVKVKDFRQCLSQFAA